MRKLKEMVIGSDGQATIEYALIVFVAVVLAGVLIAVGKPAFEQLVGVVFQKLLQVVM